MTEVRPLSKAPNPQLLPGRLQCRLPTAPSVCALILCIIVYVTNKSHLSLMRLRNIDRFIEADVNAV